MDQQETTPTRRLLNTSHLSPPQRHRDVIPPPRQPRHRHSVRLQPQQRRAIGMTYRHRTRVPPIESRVATIAQSDVQRKQSWRHSGRPKTQQRTAIVSAHPRHLAIRAEREHQRDDRMHLLQLSTFFGTLKLSLPPPLSDYGFWRRCLITLRFRRGRVGRCITRLVREDSLAVLCAMINRRRRRGSRRQHY